MDISEIRYISLFRNMNDNEIRTACVALRAEEKKYRKGSVVFHAGETAYRLGIVLSGSVTIESNDIWGNRTILNHVEAGQVFAETYALINSEPMLVDVTVNEESRILFLKAPVPGNVTDCQEPWLNKIVFNLLMISSYKNLHLSGRSFHTSPKTIRGRVMSYLNSVMLRTGSNVIDIPFDRQGLADYLNVERTALSKELGRMQNDGYFTVRKNHFVIHSLENQIKEP